MLISGNFLTMFARGSGSAASADPQSMPASNPTSAREKGLFMTAFRLGRPAPCLIRRRSGSTVQKCSKRRGFAGSQRLAAEGSAAGVVLRVQLLHALAGDVGIYLRRGKVAVTQQHLHDAQVGAVIQQMRGECM